MKTYVINLRRSQTRREFMSEQLDRLGISYDFFSAVDGRALSEQDVNSQCDFRWMRRYEGRVLSRGEIGCCLSHVGVYRKMVADKVPVALILEDDTVLPEDLALFCQALVSQCSVDRSELFYLNNGPFKKTSAQFTIADHALYPMCGGFFSHAYIINLAAARIMLETLYPIAHVPDPWTWLHRHRLVDMYCMAEPYAQQGVVNNSIIWEQGRPPSDSSFAKKIRFKGNRIFWRFVDWVLPLSWRRFI